MSADVALWAGAIVALVLVVACLRSWWLGGVWSRLDRIASAVERVAGAAEGKPDARAVCARCATRLDDDARACLKCGLLRGVDAPSR